MHICHVNLAGGFSGGERQTVNLIRELAKRGIQQSLVARPGSRLWAELESIAKKKRDNRLEAEKCIAETA